MKTEERMNVDEEDPPSWRITRTILIFQTQKCRKLINNFINKIIIIECIQHLTWSSWPYYIQIIISLLNCFYSFFIFFFLFLTHCYVTTILLCLLQFFSSPFLLFMLNFVFSSFAKMQFACLSRIFNTFNTLLLVIT